MSTKVPAKLQYVVNSGDGENLCSQCGDDADTLAKLPLTGFLRGWRRLLKGVEDPWIGLCRHCVQRLLDGFDVADAKARGGST